MSKRSSRRKRRQRKEKQRRVTQSELMQQGRTVFQQADYGTAIQLWEQARKKPNPPGSLAAALAEAYFRQAVSSPTPGITDLQQALKLQPGEQRYRYHLALAYHRQGQLDQAEPLYRQLLAETPPFERAAFSLAQLLIEQKKVVTDDPVWERLSDREQTQLAAAEALVKRKTDSTLKQLAEQPLEPLWQGLVAVALNDRTSARQNLQEIAQASDGIHPLARSVARYYLGVIAAEAEQTEAALAHWQAARADGLDSRHLRQNLSAVAYDEAIKAYQAGQPERAVEQLERVQTDSESELEDFQHQLNLELGYTAAQQGDWPQALKRWQRAEQAGDDSRRLIFNLALAYQKQEKHWEAAEYWRTLLRRRPRKDDHPDALTDEQVARIWANVAENYSMAGNYDESIKTYKNAVKWAPENLDLRLKLVEAYQIEGRWQAAENELHRILDKNPDHIQALTLLAESYSSDYFPHQARQIWLRILKLEPKHPIARQQLAHSYIQEGSRFMMWGDFQTAINIFKEGLKHVPESQHLLVVTGGSYADWGKLKQAREYLEKARAINPNDLQTLHTIYLIWLQNNSKPDLQQAFEHLKAVSGPVPGAIFLDLFERCYQADQMKEAKKILKFAEERYADDEEVLVGIARGYIDLEQDNAALAILRRVLKNNPTHIDANIQLGILYHYMDQTRLARRHWDKAQAQAHKNNDHLAVHRIKLIKDEFLHGKTPPRNPVEMLMSLPPEAREELLKDAPPELADILKNVDPEMLEMMFQLGGMGGFDDEFFDEEDYF